MGHLTCLNTNPFNDDHFFLSSLAHKSNTASPKVKEAQQQGETLDKEVDIIIIVLAVCLGFTSSCLLVLGVLFIIYYKKTSDKGNRSNGMIAGVNSTFMPFTVNELDGQV